MKVYQAVQAMRAHRGDSELWARPKTWGGSGMAVCIKSRDRRCTDDVLLVVPGPGGGSTWTPNVKTLLVDWEVVSPDTVLAENR